MSAGPAAGPGESPGLPGAAGLSGLPGEPADVVERVRFGPDGLVTVVVQEATTRQVLMVAWADAAALAETVASGWATYWSRSRRARWRKGETSGHVQRVRRVSVDCDGDSVLYEVDQTGPACHTGTVSCFDARTASLEG